MGMYTQIRGWLNVDSIGDYKGDNYKEICELLEKAKNDFENNQNLTNLDRKWVCKDTIAYKGMNGSAYLFFGTELKNYDNPAGEWIKFLISYFPNAEGRIDFQYEEDEDRCAYWLIHKGKIVECGLNDKWCDGYGNMYKPVYKNNQSN